MIHNSELVILPLSLWKHSSFKENNFITYKRIHRKVDLFCLIPAAGTSGLSADLGGIMRRCNE